MSRFPGKWWRASGGAKVFRLSDRSPRRWRIRRPRMACNANRRSVMRLMATNAAPHGSNTRHLRHGIKLRYIAVAHCALHSRLHVRPVRPGHAGSHLIDPHPRYGLARLGELGEFDDRGLVFGDRGVARHASLRCGKGHLVPRSGIGVAHLALQSKCKMGLVAVGNRLLRRRMWPEIVEHFLLSHSSRCLLRSRAIAGEKQQYDSHKHGPAALHHGTSLSEIRLWGIRLPPMRAKHLSLEPYPLPRCWCRGP